MSEMKQFGVPDFVVFIGMLIMAIVIGVYYAYKDRKKKSVENYYFGGKNMAPVPVGLSLAVSFISSITVLGYPNHAYLYGTIILWFGVATWVQIVVACTYYIPLYHRLQLSSIYEYLELRFHRSLRRLSSFISMFTTIFYMGTTVYLTAIALNAVTPMGITLSILLTAGICTLYTTVGGMKAVIWADTIQALIMAAGSIALFIKTTWAVGGTGNMWEAVERGHRNNLFDFNPDPTLIHTFWTIVVGMGMSWCSAYCVDQVFVQRFQACKSVKDAKIACIVSGIPMSLLLFVATFNGCAMYAFYEDCDPMMNGKIQKIDQTIPYLVVEIFEDSPGMAGLFVSAAYSGMLSTVSSGINALAAITLQDFIVPCRPAMSEYVQLTISKLLVLSFGVITTCVGFLVPFMGSTAIQVAVTVIGTFSGPKLGVFTLGAFFPWINTIGAFVGMVCGVIFSIWLAIGGIIYKASAESIRKLPLSSDQCSYDVTTSPYVINASDVTMNMYKSYNGTSFTLGGATTLPIQTDRPLLADTLYAVSYLYLGALGFIMTIIVAFIVTFATGKNDPKTMNAALFVPFVDNKRFPEKIRKFFRFGVPEIPPDYNIVEMKTGEFREIPIHDVPFDDEKFIHPNNVAAETDDVTITNYEKARMDVEGESIV